MATSSLDWVDQWLSPDRFAPYVRRAGGDRGRALDLYEWNARLSAAFLHDLNHFEIALRNAYDTELIAAVEPGDNHWTDDATVLKLFPTHYRANPKTGKREDANRIPRNNIKKARNSAADHRAGACSAGPTSTCAGGAAAVVCPAAVACSAGPIPPGKVVAEQTFGFWTFMTSDFHEKTLWVPYLHKAFPPHQDRSKIHKTLEAVRDLRNRVAHHESIIDGPEAKRRQLVSAMKKVRPQAEQHFSRHSEVATIIAEQP